MSQEPTIFFLGATGGCTLNALTHSLMAGEHAVALARTPSKLVSLLETQGVSSSVIKTNLRIVSGSISSIEAIKTCLTTGQKTRAVVPLIVCGIGAYPHLQLSLFNPIAMDQPHICESAVQNVRTALAEIYSSSAQPTPLEQRPTFTFISSTGLTGPGIPHDLPWILRPLYDLLGALPHKDKRLAEETLVLADAGAESFKTPLLRSWIIVRSALLDGDASMASEQGLSKVRAGTEYKPAVGYWIRRADVGNWIYEEIIRSFTAQSPSSLPPREGGKVCKWEGEKVSLTY